MTQALTEKRVSWAELFFDLVFVVAVTRVSGLLEEQHTWVGVLEAVIVFVPVYWTWVGMSVQTNLTDGDVVPLRLRMFGVALCGVFMAISLPEAYGHLAVVFTASYWLARALLAVPLVRSWRATGRVALSPYLVSVMVTGPLLVVGSLFDDPARVIIWGLMGVLDLAAPTLLRRRMKDQHFDAGHLAERFGLFVLIALGESVASITLLPEGLSFSSGAAVVAAFGLACGLWWVYFHFAADAVRHSLATAVIQIDITRLVLSYGHFAFIAAIIVVAVGLHDSVAHPTEHLSWAVTGLLFGGTALYLATFGFTRWTMFRLVSWTRLGAAAVVLVLMPFSPLVPAVVALVALVVVVAALNILEFERVSVTGWRARRHRRGDLGEAADDELPNLSPGPDPAQS